MKALLKETNRLKREEGLSAAGFIMLWAATAVYSPSTRTFLTDIRLIIPFAAICLTLGAGSYFWAIMESRLKQGMMIELTAAQRLFFRGLQLMIIIFIIISTVFLFHTHHLLMMILYIFMWLEYINYFHIRLSYLTPEEMRELFRHRTLKTSHLSRALKGK